MAWKYKPQKPGSVPCNGDAVRYFRERRGWTQEQLAHLVGCSRRLVAKAEAGQSVHADTLEELADALSSPDANVHPEDLSSSPKSVMLQFLQLYSRFERQVVSQCETFLSEEMVCFVPGNPEQLPFAGERKGIDGFDSLWRDFFDNVRRLDRVLAAKPIHLLSDGNQAIAFIHEQVDLPPRHALVPVTLHVTFERGKIIRFEDHFDHVCATQRYQASLGQK